MSPSDQALEARIRELEMTVAVQAEATKNTLFRLENIERILSRLTWLIVGGIGSAFVGFIISGGIHVPSI